MSDLGYLGFYTIAVLLYVLIFGLVGGLIGEHKGRPGAGFLFGVLLGLIGWLIIAVGPDIKAKQAALHAKKCPACMGSVPDGARKCMHCGEDLVVKPAPRPVTVGSHIPCPLCGQRIKASTLKQGENWCTFCYEKFILE